MPFLSIQRSPYHRRRMTTADDHDTPDHHQRFWPSTSLSSYRPSSLHNRFSHLLTTTTHLRNTHHNSSEGNHHHLRQLLVHTGSSSGGVWSSTDLSLSASELRFRKKKTFWSVSLSFDLLHSGHNICLRSVVLRRTLLIFCTPICFLPSGSSLSLNLSLFLFLSRDGNGMWR